MAELKGIEYLRRKLAARKARVDVRYVFYEQKNIPLDFKISSPDALRWYTEVSGWCTKAVHSISDRLTFRTFGNDVFGLNDIYRMNNADILIDSAVLGALISSCDFIYISADETGFPRLQVIDGGNATGVIDPITNMLLEGYAVLSRDDYERPVREAYFTPGLTIYYDHGRQTVRVTNIAPYPLLVPVIYRPDARRPFGHSRISRACMGYMESAQRTIKRGEVSAEFYSFPQKYILGLHPDAEKYEKWQATISSMLQIDKDEDGDRPVVGQFQQQTMTPHIEQLRMFACLFAGETDMIPDDLGFGSANPSSAEAIKASHDALRLAAEKAQASFGVGLLNAGYLAACIRDNQAYRRQQLYMTTPRWYPAFKPDAASLSTIGDGINKLSQAVPGLMTDETVGDLTGF